MAACLTLPAVGQAMLCIESKIEEIAQTAEVVFTGTVVAIVDSDYSPRSPGLCDVASPRNTDCGSKIATVELAKVLRGNVSQTATVVSEDSCRCVGPRWQVGEMFVIVAKSNSTSENATFVAESMCRGTGIASNPRSQQLIYMLSSKKR